MLKLKLYLFSLLFFLLMVNEKVLAQKKEYNMFCEEVKNEEKLKGTKTVAYNEVNWKNYEFLWMHVTGTYGGSYYCGEGKVYDIKNKKEQLNDDFYMLGSTKAVEDVIKMTGEKYVLLTQKFYETLPTSNIHFVTVRKYYKLNK